MATPNFAEVGGAFINHYYSLFDSDRAKLLPLYRESSMLTFEGAQFLGQNAIVEKLTSLPFKKVAHQILTIDSQPSIAGTGAVLVTVSGNLKLDDEENHMKFAQTFHLIPDSGTFYVLNDMFRLNLG